MRYLIAFIKKKLGLVSPGAMMNGYSYEWDMLMHKEPKVVDEMFQDKLDDFNDGLMEGERR